MCCLSEDNPVNNMNPVFVLKAHLYKHSDQVGCFPSTFQLSFKYLTMFSNTLSTFTSFGVLSGLVLFSKAAPLSAKEASIIFEGRVPLSFTNSNLDTSTGPFLT
jgi:hypothetical protein